MQCVTFSRCKKSTVVQNVTSYRWCKMTMMGRCPTTEFLYYTGSCEKVNLFVLPNIIKQRHKTIYSAANRWESVAQVDAVMWFIRPEPWLTLFITFWWSRTGWHVIGWRSAASLELHVTGLHCVLGGSSRRRQCMWPPVLDIKNNILTKWIFTEVKPGKRKALILLQWF